MARLAWTISRDMFLSIDEVERLLRAVRGPTPARSHATAGGEPGSGAEGAGLTDRVIVESLLFSGLRASELCALRLGDSPAGRGEDAFVVRGPRERRTVYLPASVAALVRDYARRVRPAQLPEGAEPGDPRLPLFFNERRRPFERTGLYRRVVAVLTAAGLGERASVQLLRHTYGYLAYLRTGGNLLFVQRQLGHAHPMITSVYARFVEERYNRLADAVAGADAPRSLPARKKPRPARTR